MAGRFEVCEGGMITFHLDDNDCAIIIPRNGEPNMIIPDLKECDQVGQNVMAGMHLYLQLADGVEALAAAFEKQSSEVPVQ
jgi:hypothetical protein